MATLNEINCVSGNANTGIGTCSFDPKEVIGALLVPKGTRLSKDDIDDLKGTLIAGANNNDKKARFYPIGRFVAIEDSSDDNTEQTMGYGDTYIIKEGNYKWVFQFVNGAKCYHTKLRTFNDSQDRFDVYFIDKQNALIGTLVTNQSDGQEELKGFALAQIYTPKMKLADGSNMSEYTISFALSDSSEFNDKIGFVIADFNILSEIKGMVDINLSSLSTVALSTGVTTIDLKASCGSTSLSEIFASELADITIYLASNANTGASIVVSSATVNPNNVVLTLDKNDINFPSASEFVNIKLAAPSVLATAGLESPEGNSFEGVNTLKVKVV